MKNKQFEISIIICILVMSLILLGIYLVYSKYRKENSYNIFLSNNNGLKCFKYSCESVTFENDGYYKIYINGEYKGINKVKYNDSNNKLYVFDNFSNNIYKDKSKKIFIYDGNASISQIDFATMDIDRENIDLISQNINYDISDYTFAYKVKNDFDNDGDNEEIAIVKNENKAYIIVAYINDNKVSVLENIQNEDYMEVPSIYINNIIDIFDDGKLELILSIGYYDNIGSCEVVYRLKNNKFKALNVCDLKNN